MYLKKDQIFLLIYGVFDFIEKNGSGNVLLANRKAAQPVTCFYQFYGKKFLRRLFTQTKYVKVFTIRLSYSFGTSPIINKKLFEYLRRYPFSAALLLTGSAGRKPEAGKEAPAGLKETCLFAQKMDILQNKKSRFIRKRQSFCIFFTCGMNIPMA